MTPIEYILSGIAVALFAGLLGYIVGDKNKISGKKFDNICKERQASCSTHICSELEHIKEDQKDMKKDIKELLRRINYKNTEGRSFKPED